MKIKIVVVGRLKDRYLEEGIKDYLKRLQRYAPTELVRVREEGKFNQKAEAEAIRREGSSLLNHVGASDRLVALSEEGLSLTSQQWAQRLEACLQSGVSQLVYTIGSGPGLAKEVKERANWTLSLSPLTFPHQLALLLLLEQCYRSWTILRREPYHR